MKLELQIALSQLASKELQERFCVNGTKDEYLLPEELYDSAFNWAKSAVKSAELNPDAVAIIQRFLSELDQTKDWDSDNERKISAAELILENPDWDRAREAAKRCLAELGWELIVAD